MAVNLNLRCLGWKWATFVDSNGNRVNVGNFDEDGLKAMSLRYRPNGSKIYITIGTDGKAGVESMKEALKYRNINFDYFDILQAKIKVVFKLNGKNRPVTFDITHGKGHNLASREQDMLVRKLLIKWGIDTAEL